MDTTTKERIEQISKIVEEKYNISMPENGPWPTGLDRLCYAIEKAAGITPKGGYTGIRRLYYDLLQGGIDVDNTDAPVSLDISGGFANPQYVGGAVDLTGFTFTVTFVSGDVRAVPYTDLVLSTTTWMEEGEQTLDIRYAAHGDTVSGQVMANVLADRPIELLVSGDWQNTQTIGVAPDTTGLSFTAKWGSGATESVTPEVSPSVWGDTGTQVATFSYTTAGYTVTATKEATVLPAMPASMEITGDWTNAQTVGAAPDPTGLVFTVSMSDNTQKTVTPTSVSPVVWDAVGEQTATFSYTEAGATVSATKTAIVVESGVYDVVGLIEGTITEVDC